MQTPRMEKGHQARAFQGALVHMRPAFYTGPLSLRADDARHFKC